MRRSISCRASTAFEAFSSGSPRVCTDRSNSRLTSAENLARLIISLGFARRQTSTTCTGGAFPDGLGYFCLGPCCFLLTVPCSPVSANRCTIEQADSMITAPAGPTLSSTMSCRLYFTPRLQICRVLRAAEQGHSHLECYVLSLAITVEPQHQPLALPSLLLKVPLHRLLVLHCDPGHHQSGLY